MRINWKAIWRWVGHLSTAQWVFSLVFPTVTLSAAFGIFTELPTALAIAFGFLLGLASFTVWHTVVWIRHQTIAAKLMQKRSKEETDQKQQESPIHVEDGFFTDCDHVVDEDGNDVPRVYSVALCLWVTNALDTGVVLRNLSARFHFLGGEWATLPIRGQESGRVDLQHGAVAKIEIGRVLYRSVGNEIPAMPRPKHKQISTKDQIEYNSSPKSDHRHIMISNVDSGSPNGIGQLNDESRFNSITIVVSADDVVSKTVKLQTNLFAEKANEWLQFLPQDS